VSTGTDWAQPNQIEPVDEFVAHLRSDVCTLHFGAEQTAGNRAAHLGRVQAGAIDVLKYTGYGVQWGNRRPDHIRVDWADYYLICLPLTARLAVRQNGTETVLQPGYFAFLDISKPFWGQISPVDDSRTFSALHARIPGSLLRRSLPVAADFCNRPVEVRPGSGNLLRVLLDAAIAEGPHLSLEHSARLGKLLFDTICEAATPLAQAAAKASAARTGKQHVYERARQFIEAHLSEPHLDGRRVAEHCGVSLRYLQAAFEAAGTTVASYIRESRLNACRAALRDPTLRGRSISEIALGWGFCDLSHFSHAYKARFGRTPREERSLAGAQGTALR
jgi:AraC-like DNA-binding protein